MDYDKTELFNSYRQHDVISHLDNDTDHVDAVTDIEKKYSSIIKKIDMNNDKITEIEKMGQKIFVEINKQKLDVMYNNISRLISELDSNSKLIKSELVNFTVGKDNKVVSDIYQNCKEYLISKLVDQTDRYNEINEKITDNVNKKLIATYKVVNQVTQKEAEDAINKGGVVNYQEIILKQEANEALSYIENRHLQILELASNISELKSVFVDFSLLLQNQTDVIINIEKHVDNANNDINSGVKQLQGAVKLQNKSRCMMCLILVFLLIGLGLILMFVYM